VPGVDAVPVVAVVCATGDGCCCWHAESITTSNKPDINPRILIRMASSFEIGI
jgi:hypothetical protein